MPSARIVRSSGIMRSPRVQQVEGMFDVSPSERSIEEWTVDLPLDAHAWHVGLIVGPSGCGKSTIARELFGDAVCNGFDWPVDRSLLDGFPSGMSIKDITALISSVGFSSPPLWLRPFEVLSTGQQMRVTVARLLAQQRELAVMDEFTSVVDRTVAQIGSAAIAKTVRKRNQRFVAVTCHYDVLEWLQPDWIYQPHTNEFQWRCLQRHPDVELEIVRVHSSAWSLFRQYHYLDTNLHKAAQCFGAFWNDIAVAFAAVLPFPHPRRKNTRREHRVVCLPDYQGVGIGNALSDYMGALCGGLGWSYLSSTGHPGIIQYRNRSANWRLMRPPSFSLVGRKDGTISPSMTSPVGSSTAKPWTGVYNRLTASFEYVGPKLNRDESSRIWHDQLN